MARKIINHFTHREGRKIVISTTPRFVKVNGVFQPIEKVISVGWEPNGEGFWITAAGKTASIKLQKTHKGKVRDKIKHLRTGIRHFGPILDGSPGKLTWDLDAEFEGLPLPNGDIVLHDDGVVKLGIFLHDWRKKFKCSKSGSKFTLDLTDVAGEINLDPTTIDAGENGTFVATSGDSWATVRGAASGTVEPGIQAVSAQLLDGPTYSIERFIMHFDTSLYAPESLSKVQLYSGWDGDPGIANVKAGHAVSDGEVGAPGANFARALPPTPLVPESDDEGVYATIVWDVTEQYTQNEFSAYGIVATKDADNVEPLDDSAIYLLDATPLGGGHFTQLVLTEAPPSGGCTVLSSGMLCLGDGE